jgi:hypothetical protein
MVIHEGRLVSEVKSIYLLTRLVATRQTYETDPLLVALANLPSPFVLRIFLTVIFETNPSVSDGILS